VVLPLLCQPADKQKEVRTSKMREIRKNTKKKRKRKNYGVPQHTKLTPPNRNSKKGKEKKAPDRANIREKGKKEGNGGHIPIKSS